MDSGIPQRGLFDSLSRSRRAPGMGREGYFCRLIRLEALAISMARVRLLDRFFLKDTSAGKAPGPVIQNPYPIAFVVMKGEVFHIIVKDRKVFMLFSYPSDIRVAG